MKKDIREEAQEMSDSGAQRIKRSVERSWKFEGNKKKYIFNSLLSNIVTGAQKALKRRRLKTVQQNLEDLKKKLKKRNKLVRLGDKSPAGWDLVNEYLSDELTRGSEDERRIKKAEQATLRKRSQRAQQRNKVTSSHLTPHSNNWKRQVPKTEPGISRIYRISSEKGSFRSLDIPGELIFLENLGLEDLFYRKLKKSGHRGGKFRKGVSLV